MNSVSLFIIKGTTVTDRWTFSVWHLERGWYKSLLFLYEFIIVRYIFCLSFFCFVLFFGFLAITTWPQARTVSSHFTMKPSIQKKTTKNALPFLYRDWTLILFLFFFCICCTFHVFHTRQFWTISSHAKVTYLILFCCW